jgi:hypothetical protein
VTNRQHDAEARARCPSLSFLPPTPSTHTTAMVKSIESLAEFREIIEKDSTAVIDFWATWCGPWYVPSLPSPAPSDTRRATQGE